MIYLSEIYVLEFQFPEVLQINNFAKNAVEIPPVQNAHENALAKNANKKSNHFACLKNLITPQKRTPKFQRGPPPETKSPLGCLASKRKTEAVRLTFFMKTIFSVLHSLAVLIPIEEVDEKWKCFDVFEHVERIYDRNALAPTEAQIKVIHRKFL